MRYLVEAVLMNPQTRLLETFYWSSGGNFPPFLPSDSARPNRYYAPVVQKVNGVSVSLFPKGATSGESSLGAGVITLLNLGGELDFLISWGYVGRSIKVWYGNTNVFSDYTLYFSGVIDTIDFSYNSKSAASLKITVKDKKKLFQKDVTTSRYLGVNEAASGNEGTSDGGIKNKLKPQCLGRCWNITPVLVNDAGHRYQVHDGAIYDVDAVYDNGVALSKSLTYPPASGYYFVDASIGVFVLGAKPAGQITCDVKGATLAGVWVYTYADIGRYMAKVYGGLSDADIDLESLTTLNATMPYTVGIYVSGVEAPKIGETSSSTILSMFDTLLQDSLVYWIFDIQGKFSMGSILPPETQPSLQTLDNYTNIEIELLPNVDSNQGIPCGSLSLQAVKNWTVQTSGLAGVVTSTRQSWLKQEFREFPKYNETNAFVYNSDLTKVVKNSLLAVEAEADEVAQLLMNFYSVGRRPFKVILDQSKLLPEVVPTKCITLKMNRVGFQAGRKVLVLGIAYNTPRINQVELTVYGKVGADL